MGPFSQKGVEFLCGRVHVVNVHVGDIMFPECGVDGQRHHVTIRETNMATSSL